MSAVAFSLPPTADEIADLRARLDEAEETLRAIRSGEVEAIVVEGSDGPHVFSLNSAEAESNRIRGEILAQVSDAVVATNCEQRVTFLNAAAERQYGVTSAEVLGSKLEDVYTERWLHPEDETAAHAALKEKGEWRGENIHITRSGRELRVESSKTVLHDGSGQQGGVIAAIRDVTERKFADHTLARMAAIIDSSDDAIISKTLDGIITSWNRGAEKVFGYSAAETIGHSMLMLFPADRVKEEPEILARIASGQAVKHFESIRLRKDGTPIHVSATISPIKDHTGKIVGASKVARDITERKRVEAALEKATQDANAANQAKDAFLSQLSHELRTPLTPVLMVTSALLGEGITDLALREDLMMIRRNVELEVRLIDDLLDVTRIVNGKLVLAEKRCDLHETVRHALEICEAGLRQRRIEIALRLDAPGAVVLGDPARLKQVFWNLINNATKFTPEGGRIEISSELIDDRVRVAVRDNGMGIDLANLPDLFKPFEQGGVATTRKFGGLGLGLAICHGVITLHGGRIWAKSDGLGKGAIFLVELSRVAAGD